VNLFEGYAGTEIQPRVCPQNFRRIPSRHEPGSSSTALGRLRRCFVFDDSFFGVFGLLREPPGLGCFPLLGRATPGGPESITEYLATHTAAPDPILKTLVFAEVRGEAAR
jgi:hypothetical protein